MRKLWNKKISLTLNLRILIPLVLIAGLLIVNHLLNQTKSNSTIKNEVSENSLSVIANRAVSSCQDSSNKIDCYDLKVPELTTNLSMEDSFNVVALVQKNDQTYLYSHVLAHKLSSREVAKDPSKWMDVIPRCPNNGMGSNGCIHGALQERFRAATLSSGQIKEVVPDLQIACEKRNNFNPTGLAQAICYHGLGHLTTYVTDADFPKAVEICNQIAFKADGRNFSRVCYEGLFMQLFQPLETEDFALVNGLSPAKENLRSFCEGFKGSDVVEACYREGWPLFRTEINTPSGLEAFCQRASSQVQISNCYQSLFHIIGRGDNFDSQKISTFCSAVSSSLQGECFSNTSLSAVEENQTYGNKAIEICNGAKKLSSDASDICFKTLAEYAGFNLDAKSILFSDFCKMLPNKYQESCLKAKGASN